MRISNLKIEYRLLTSNQSSFLEYSLQTNLNRTCKKKTYNSIFSADVNHSTNSNWKFRVKHKSLFIWWESQTNQDQKIAIFTFEILSIRMLLFRVSASPDYFEAYICIYNTLNHHFVHFRMILNSSW